MECPAEPFVPLMSATSPSVKPPPRQRGVKSCAAVGIGSRGLPGTISTSSIVVEAVMPVVVVRLSRTQYLTSVPVAPPKAIDVDFITEKALMSVQLTTDFDADGGKAVTLRETAVVPRIDPSLIAVNDVKDESNGATAPAVPLLYCGVVNDWTAWFHVRVTTKFTASIGTSAPMKIASSAAAPNVPTSAPLESEPLVTLVVTSV